MATKSADKVEGDKVRIEGDKVEGDKKVEARVPHGRAAKDDGASPTEEMTYQNDAGRGHPIARNPNGSQ